ncbi:MAG TPA: alpha/beta hydrolase [Solirubrobacteraceae bacterium]|nr:alpha/beta hydrolase [Solirubrobacteraceae bacterium]
MDVRELTVPTPDGVLLAGEESGGGPLDGMPGEESAGRQRGRAAGALGVGAGTGGGDRAEEGQPIVLLHGLTATRRYVVMGSRLLQRAGHRVIAYDARGHGRSTPAPTPAAYGYELLAEDLRAMLDARGIARAALAGASMGAHTILRLALDHPDRVGALGIVTPAYDPDAPAGATPEGDRDRLARALRDAGVEGFLDAYDFTSVPAAWRETVRTVVRQRLSAHEHPEAVADAMEVVPRSRPFARMADLAAIAVPTLVVASRDEVDPGHPLALAERYAAAIPGAALAVEDGGPPLRSPIAWQGGQLSKAILGLLERVR